MPGRKGRETLCDYRTFGIADRSSILQSIEEYRMYRLNETLFMYNLRRNALRHCLQTIYTHTPDIKIYLVLLLMFENSTNISPL